MTGEALELHRTIRASVRDMLDAYRIQAHAGPVRDQALEEILFWAAHPIVHSLAPYPAEQRVALLPHVVRLMLAAFPENVAAETQKRGRLMAIYHRKVNGRKVWWVRVNHKGLNASPICATKEDAKLAFSFYAAAPAARRFGVVSTARMDPDSTGSERTMTCSISLLTFLSLLLHTIAFDLTGEQTRDQNRSGRVTALESDPAPSALPRSPALVRTATIKPALYRMSRGDTSAVVARRLPQGERSDAMKRIILALVLCAVVPGPAGAEPSHAPMIAQAKTDQEAPPKVERARALTLRGTVEAIDKEKHTVTLKGPHRSLTVHVRDPKKLEAIQVGDPVIGKYYEALMVEVKKPGEGTPGVTTQQAVARSKPGEVPAGAVGQQITVTATIEAIDKKARTVTIKGPEGNSVTVTARDPKNLDKVKVGDNVEITYTEALAISLDKSAKK
jgi:hypothetical protein